MNIQFDLKDIAEIFDCFNCEYTDSGDFFVGYFFKPTSNVGVFITRKIINYYGYTFEIDMDYSEDDDVDDIRIVTNIPYQLIIIS